VSARTAPTAASIKRTAKSTLRHFVHATYDRLDRQGKVNPLVPPRQINPNIGFIPRRSAYAQEFISSGSRIAEMLVSYAALRPAQSVLDIGCGIGRVARALTTVIQPPGQYHGFDVDPKAVAWCRRAYRPFPNFAFAYAPVGYLNVKGVAPIRGEDFVFPYADATIDLAYSVSVYTHLSRGVIDHYLAETARVLRPGGACVNTFFVVDESAVEAMRAGRADRLYFEQGDGIYLCDPHNPNLGIGFAPVIIQRLHQTHGLTIEYPVRVGTWTGREVESFVYQDVVVARKAHSISQNEGLVSDNRPLTS
jgi:SAM-dependent methyltransferase